MKSVKKRSIQVLCSTKISCLFLIQFFCFNSSFGQAVAIVGINTDSPDGFALVALVDIPEGSNIFFTDMSYNSASNTYLELDINGNPSTANGSVQITWTGTWAEGTVIRLVETSTNNFVLTASAGGPTGLGASIVYAGDGFSLSGSDSFSVYTSSSTTDPENNIGEIYGYVTFDPVSADPDPSLDPDCPCSTDFASIDFNNSSVDHINFNPGIRGGTVSLSDFNNLANYVTSSSNTVMDLTPFGNLTFGSSASLPVELLYFDAIAREDLVNLSWTTGSEINNEGFEIQHSTHNNDWETIGFVPGNGNSVIIQGYSYQHKNPIDGTNYYRLKQIDYDGSFEYSKVRVAHFHDLNADGNALTVFPNPTKRKLHVSVEKKFDTVEKMEYQILNQEGQIFRKEIINTESNDFLLFVDALEAGIYILRVKRAGEVYSTKFMKE